MPASGGIIARRIKSVATKVVAAETLVFWRKCEIIMEETAGPEINRQSSAGSVQPMNDI